MPAPPLTLIHRRLRVMSGRIPATHGWREWYRHRRGLHVSTTLAGGEASVALGQWVAEPRDAPTIDPWTAVAQPPCRGLAACASGQDKAGNGGMLPRWVIVYPSWPALSRPSPEALARQRVPH